MTQVELARQGTISEEVRSIAAAEGVTAEFVQEGLAQGTIVVPANINRRLGRCCGIGKGLTVKVNANIGTSSDFCDVEVELEKVRVADEYRADTVMDLSTGGDLTAIRRAILEHCPVPLGTVPIYQAGIEAIQRRGAIVKMSVDDLFDTIEAQAVEGVDFMTVHCGVTMAAIERLKRQGRVTNIVSRGGAFLLGWILHNERENPLYEHYDR
ncbi:MAG: phosphomethylpyrimidine synthase ThiC, partial [Chloroflexota bacterium]